ncbi:MAG: D-glycero-beta-D-manno-heptose-7-phosphate kinase [Gemmatimonadetes bacterium]|nr:D-glycero-beta-D-manno-heptose-7-phosphate kinase [Gemmatimonadota bacterium]
MTAVTLTRARLEELLARTAGRPPRIAIVGDAMLDVYLQGDVERISPEAPVPVVRVQARHHALGGAANVAQNVAALGGQAELVATVGDDAAGAKLRAMLEAIGAPGRGLVTTIRPTTTKTRVVARGQQVVRVDEEIDHDVQGNDVRAIEVAVRRAVDAADALVLEDYDKGVLVESVIRAAITQARQRGVPIIVDPKYRHFFAFGGATVFKPNRRELEAALGAAVDLDHPEAFPDILRRLNVDRLLLTLGERGMALIEPDGRTHRIPTTAREVFDVVGAGDTVTAYLAAILAVGGTPLEAAVIANHAAGVQVGKSGAAAVSPAEVLLAAS